METKIIFSKNLKQELIARKIKQKELAKAIGVSEPTVTQWLKGEVLPSLDTFRKICIFLKRSLLLYLRLIILHRLLL